MTQGTGYAMIEVAWQVSQLLHGGLFCLGDVFFFMFSNFAGQ